ncbi:hypothetical protein [Nocardioides sp. NPDC047086]|uniref:hypothetical protein n=1 Tax=Nocardioides sp. NPDC047086 TaxID=3154810 RepID=UPI0033C9C58C
MDVDVVPGSVTYWTVTLEDQRRLKRALMRIRVASPGFWIGGVAIPPILAGLVLWALTTPRADLPLEIGPKAATAVAVAVLVPVLVGGEWTVRRRLERDFPIGATFTSWATKSGMGVRTPNHLAFYPWSRLTQVDRGSVLVRFPQPVGRWRQAVPLSLVAGPEEHSVSVDFPVQLIGPGIAREMAMGSRGQSGEGSLPGVPVVIDRALQRRLGREWMRGQMGAMRWLIPVLAVLQCAIDLIDGAYRFAIFWMVILLLNTVTTLLGGARPVARMYPVGATVVGLVGESVVIQGPWGSVAWHRGWLRQVRATEHTVTYEILQRRRRGGLASIDKWIVVIPRAFLDTPAPAVGTEV